MASNADAVRFASYNVSLFREEQGQLISDLSTPDNDQAQAVAEIIQRNDPDVLLLNEFDFDPNSEAAQLFQENYLSVSQNGADPVEYPYVYVAPSNTGISSGFDLNNDGVTATTPGDRAYGDDSLGFGEFPGQYAMALFSKHPIVTDDVRTFQNFLWQDMPGALLPGDPETAAADDWYSPEELEVFRLSSKSHWDIPIEVDGQVIHVLASHPTPPGFDGPEDRNGTRNYDEIRFWADYVTPGEGDYIYDDAGNTGGLSPGASFVIMGDQNADPFDGSGIPGAIQQLLNNPRVNTSLTPASAGGVEQAELQGEANATQISDPQFDTADFNDTLPDGPGNLRVDYVLPSEDLRITDAAVFWPESSDPLFPLVGTFPFPSSDHRLVAADLTATPTVEPTVETPPVFDLEDPPSDPALSDADDPAIYVAADPEASLVIGSLKNGGLQVYNLAGEVLQTIAPDSPDDLRYNNVDLVYGFNLDGQQVDLAIASDRTNDTLAIFQIDSDQRLSNITADNIPESIFGVDDGEQTAYGLATYTSPSSGKSYVFVSQRESNQVAQLELIDNGEAGVSATPIRTLTLPIPEDGELEDAQVEGMVADRELGDLYVGQEAVGIWKFSAEPDGGDTGDLIDQTYPDGSNLQADVEGLTIYYAGDGQGYLLASSQGDSTFAVYNRQGNNDYLGSFRIGAANGIDSVQNSDGADVINLPLGPEFPSGLLVSHDGSNEPALLTTDDGELENVSTNFKFVPWENVANAFPEPLEIDTTSSNPRSLSVGGIRFGSPDSNELEADTGETIFAGAGNDILDASSGGGGNRLYAGAGNDELFASNNNRLFGEAGKDMLDASVGTGDNRLYSGAGNDTLFAGVNDRLFASSGDDVLFAGNGSSSLTGGEGADQFWIAFNGLPAATNTITDYQIGTDAIGIGGLTGVSSIDDLSLTQTGEDTAIAALDRDLAILIGVQATDLNRNSFVFA